MVFSGALSRPQATASVPHQAGRHKSTAGKQSSARGTSTCTQSAGGDAVQGWMDLAKLVSGGGGFKSAYKDLAQKIGGYQRTPDFPN